VFGLPLVQLGDARSDTYPPHPVSHSTPRSAIDAAQEVCSSAHDQVSKGQSRLPIAAVLDGDICGKSPRLPQRGSKKHIVAVKTAECT